MVSTIRKIPPSGEFFLVVFIAFGYFIYLSSWWIGNPPNEPVKYVYSNIDCLRILIQELITLFFLGWFLWIRGWKISHLRIRISWRSIVGGILLWAIYFSIYMLIFSIVVDLIGGHEIFDRVSFEARLNPALALIFIVVNSIFEEILVVGYVIQALEAKHGIVFAIGVSVFIRLLYHTYQGPLAAVSIIPLGLIFGIVYWRWRNLVPIIVAHTTMNGLALS